MRSGEKQRLLMPFGILEYLWKESTYWSMVTVPPDRIPVTATETGYLAAILAMQRVSSARAARTAFATFLERWPGNETASVGLANIHYAQGELKEAEAVLRRAAERHPDSAVVLNNLAQTLSDEGRNDEALNLIDKAVALPGPFAAAAAETRATIMKRLEGKK